MANNTYDVKILETEHLTHDVRRLVVEKPDGYHFEPGQATEVAIDKEGWRDEKRPFTFTSIDRDPLLEFTIKIYPKRDGVTEQVEELEIGDELTIGEPWGAIKYRGSGTFIAGGAGLTPFIAILRDLHAEGQLNGDRLIFSNHERRDIIMRTELKRMLGEKCLFTLTDPQSEQDAREQGYLTGRVDEAFLERHIDSPDQVFYLCGPPEMVREIAGDLENLGVKKERIVHEDL